MVKKWLRFFCLLGIGVAGGLVWAAKDLIHQADKYEVWREEPYG